MYELLDINFDYAHGESFYRDQVDQVYSVLLKHEICSEDQGALVVFHRSIRDFQNNLLLFENPMEQVTMQLLILPPLVIVPKNGKRNI